MPFDGVVLSNIKHEIESLILGGKIYKIYQPEKDEIIITIRNLHNNYKLLLSANSLYPKVHFTNLKKNNPQIAPMFCMILRKYLNNAKIISLVQPNFERILEIHLESLNELGDLSIKKLIIEIMGKHSNIILIDENNNIIDSIKHIPFYKSSVREILPNKKYVYPPSNKLNPLEICKDSFINLIKSKKNFNIQEAIYKSYNGISPLISNNICFSANLENLTNIEDIDHKDIEILYTQFENFIKLIKNKFFNPQIIYNKNNILDFTSINLNLYKNYNKKFFNSISELVEFFYKEKEISYRSKQKSYDIKKIVEINLERCIKKRELQLKIIEEVKNREIFKIYGELIISNIYSLKKGDSIFKAVNFYSNKLEEIEIPLDINLTPSQNAQKYFKKYNKYKRTFNATNDQIKINEEIIKYLDSILAHLSQNLEEIEIEEIKEEMIEEGLIKRKNIKIKDKKIKKSSPIKYLSSDGFYIFIGKNNKQNDEITMNLANKNDIWMHAKNIPGSHVIIKTNGKTVPDTTIKEAAQLAAYYSKDKNSNIISVDYTYKKYVKKPNGSKPGNVIYNNYKTILVSPKNEI